MTLSIDKICFNFEVTCCLTVFKPSKIRRQKVSRVFFLVEPDNYSLVILGNCDSVVKAIGELVFFFYIKNEICYYQVI